METLIEHLTTLMKDSKFRPSMCIVVGAKFIGTNRGPFKKGGRYDIVLHPCAGSRYHNGQWIRDERVQVYRTTPGNDGFKMYESGDAVMEDFAV